MDAQTKIGQRIGKISEIFQYASTLYMVHKDLDLLLTQLDNIEITYRSLAYEAVSVDMAVEELSSSNTISRWRSFLNGPASPHSVQVHTGLGWAIARQGISPIPFIETLTPLMRYRMLDGWGFYHGMFRQRQSLSQQVFPLDIDSPFRRGFDQGLGRSLWYINKGVYDNIPKIIGGFKEFRQADLWRGIGIACSYVAGYDEFILRDLFSRSFPYHTQLSVGTALVIKTINNSKSSVPDIELACRIWCNRSLQQVLLITENAEPSLSADVNDAYLNWISSIEEKLKQSNID